MMSYVFFFFSSRRRHTRSYGDWSSDVCSSDLAWRCSAARSHSRARPAEARRSPSRCRRNEARTMIRVLLADDHAIVIEGLRALLDGEPDIKVAAWTTD